AVVAVAGVSAIVVLITVVLPRFAKILADLGQALPASTQVVLRMADAGRAAALPMGAAFAVVLVAWHAWARTNVGRRRWHQLLLAVPVLGSVRRGAATARVAHSMAALLESGVPVSSAMTFAARASADAELEARILEARAKVGAGQTLSQALESTDAVNVTTVRLVRAGEESGRLPSMLSHAAKIEQQRADRPVRPAVLMPEPPLLLPFASVVALVAAALLQAIYSVRPTV